MSPVNEPKTVQFYKEKTAASAGAKKQFLGSHVKLRASRSKEFGTVFPEEASFADF